MRHMEHDWLDRILFSQCKRCGKSVETVCTGPEESHTIWRRPDGIEIKWDDSKGKACVKRELGPHL